MGHDHIVSQLLQAGAHVDAARHVRLESVETDKQVLWFQDGATALFKASHKGYSAVVGELLKYKPSVGILPVSALAIKFKIVLGYMIQAVSEWRKCASCSRPFRSPDCLQTAGFSWRRSSAAQPRQLLTHPDSRAPQACSCC